MLANKAKIKAQTAYLKQNKNSRMSFLLLFLLVGFYLIGAIFFQNHYYMNTTINKVNRDMITPEQLIANTKEAADNYQLTICDSDGNRYILKGSEIGYTYEDSGNEAAILQEQNCWLWPRCMVEEYVYEFSVTCSYDPKLLREKVSELPITGLKATDKDRFIEQVEQSLDQGQEILILDNPHEKGQKEGAVKDK